MLGITQKFALCAILALAAPSSAQAARVQLEDINTVIGEGCSSATYALAIPHGGHVIDVREPLEGEPIHTRAGTHIADIATITIGLREVVWTLQPVETLCGQLSEWETEEVPFRALANVPLRMMTRRQATRYMREILETEGFAGYGYQRRCSRLSRYRFRCYANWIAGDTSNRAAVTVWHSLDRQTGETFYRYRGRVRVTNHYCQAVGRSGCVREYRIRR